ncbi:MAG: hypothetical protein FOGNACKC_00824 [Anaerolineae bacterium]|nr:hypothetical protein [Anaerolineae bacterium]
MKAQKWSSNIRYDIEATTEQGLEWAIGACGWLITNSAETTPAEKAWLDYWHANKLECWLPPQLNRDGTERAGLQWFVTEYDAKAGRGKMQFDPATLLAFERGEEIYDRWVKEALAGMTPEVLAKRSKEITVAKVPGFSVAKTLRGLNPELLTEKQLVFRYGQLLAIRTTVERGRMLPVDYYVSAVTASTRGVTPKDMWLQHNLDFTREWFQKEMKRRGLMIKYAFFVELMRSNV